jgi:hypothetical protein
LPTLIGEPTYVCFLLLKYEQDLAVPTGVEPANIDLKDRRLYQFAYGTKL